ncbi:MAG: TOTE conflict system archaeo-eukaryotic primase domain-containing protein [Bullifex sp.]
MLFSLFHGRRDVYAARKYKGYYPVCINHNGPSCPRKGKKEKINCVDCSRRQFAGLTPDVIVTNHLCNHDSEGIGAIGIYPMLSGNNCMFAAIDLDEATWKQDSLCVASVARKAGFQIAIEVSFSGNGAHLWLFFYEEVPARKARKLMMSFLDEACRKSETIRLTSYDRIFPAQDELKKDGIGNLILMPLVLSAASRQDNRGTLFVDNSFRYYPDQIAFLSSIPKYGNTEIDSYLETLNGKSAVLCNSGMTEPDPLWNIRLPRITSSDSNVPVLPVYLSAGISIPKRYVTPAFIDCIRRLASYRDPEYYITLERNKGYVPKDTSCFISLFLESDSVIQLPRGYYSQFRELMRKAGIRVEFSDLRKSGTGLDVTSSVVLRKEQTTGLEAMLNNETGVVRAATSFGKTVLAAAIIAYRKEKTLVIVNSRQLMDQWQQKLESVLTVSNPPVRREHKRINRTGIGVFGGQKDTISGFVDIATVQSLASSRPEWIREYGLVIVDECHHAASDQYRDVLSMVRPKYLYGLTATDKRKDGHEKSVYAFCGSVIFSYDAYRLAYERGIMQMFIPRFMNTVYIPSAGCRNSFTDIVKTLSSDKDRNESIANDAVLMMDSGHRVLILTSLIAHAETLHELISNKGKNSMLIHGKQGRTDKASVHGRIAAVPETGVIIISTMSYLGEGTDIPYLDTLLLAAPVSWKGLLSQIVGRICRSCEGKREVSVFDYVDVYIPECLRMYNKRVSAYGKLGFVPSGGVSDVHCEKIIYRSDTYGNALLSSLRCARKSVEISGSVFDCDYFSNELFSFLHMVSEKGVHIKIHAKKTNAADSMQSVAGEYVRSIGMELVYEDFPLNYAVIDSSEVYFGDINILSRDQEGRDNMMIHFTSSRIAEELTGFPDLFSD